MARAACRGTTVARARLLLFKPANNTLQLTIEWSGHAINILPFAYLYGICLISVTNILLLPVVLSLTKVLLILV